MLQSSQSLVQEKLTLVEQQALQQRWQAVLEQVSRAAKGQSQQVTLLAVSKTKPASMVQALAEAGQVDFGENYLQEALDKIQVLKSQQPSIIWHYIGHIQRNKTRDIAENFAWVHTIEREIIAKRLNNQRPENLPALNVLIQVNIDLEESKSGCLPEDVEALVCAIKDYPKLCLRGLMIIPAKEDTQAFARTQALFNTIKSKYPELTAWDTLSMGMSGDMVDAITHGSTMVRVGTAIFGARN
ncbi:YggS family pyridoxal phosphate-dependent enzyme [Psychrobacter sp. I-STPA6b]|uniref:YggS family pyridoxal phosphate-dependent enzyme n=1 Tax=Psychrobacter sp. I-STPA6b TaxID=2585718 RepID=UPI001D0C9E7E|nr:YggS family pyridoxal phosphate-dependent enzyme [Psychrobacter sp. I-STPA6b]